MKKPYHPRLVRAPQFKLTVKFGQGVRADINDSAQELGAILLADRNNPLTSPTQRDANIAHAVRCWNAAEFLTRMYGYATIDDFLDAVSEAEELGNKGLIK